MEWILGAALALSVAANAILGGSVHFLVRSQEAMTRVLSAEYRHTAEHGAQKARAWNQYKRRPENTEDKA